MLKVNNKKAIRRLSARSLKNSKTRNIIAVVAIILTTVLFTSVFSVGMSAIDSMQQATMRQVGTRAHGGFKFLTWQQYEKLLEDPKIKDISYNIIIGFAENEVLKKTYTEIRYTEEKSAKWGFCEPTTGTLPVKKMDVATSTKVLDALGLPHELGVQVPLQFTANGKKYSDTFTLCGFWEQDSVAMANEAFLSREYCDEVAPVWQTGDVIDFDAVNFSGSVNPSYFFSHSWNLEKQVQELKDRCGFDATVNEGVNWAYASATVDAGTIAMLASVLFVIMLSGYLIIYNIFYISVSNEIRYYGLLKTIGTTNRQLRRIVRRQALLLSLIGIPAGLLLGYLCSMWIVPIMMRVSAFRDAFVVSTNPVVFVGSAVFTLLTVWVSCIRPCRFVSRISPVEAVRYTEQTNSGKKKSRKSKKVHPLSMAYANIRRTPKKTAAVILSLSLSLILLNGTVTIVSGFDMDKYIKESIVSDFYMTDASMTNPMSMEAMTDRVSPELVEEVGKLDGVTDNGCVYMKEYEHKLNEPALTRAKNNLEEFEELVHYPEIIEQSRQMLDEGRIDSHLYGIDPFIINKMELVEGNIDPEKFATGNFVVATTLVDTGEGKFCYIGGTALFTLTLGSLLGYVLVYAIANQMWFFTYHFVIAPVLLVLPVLFILAVLIPSVCYRQMNKQSVVERLREAEN